MVGPPGFSIPGWFVAFIVIGLLISIGTFVWRISVARRIAENAGLDPKTATAVTMLSKDGVDAAYLASTLAARQHPPTPPTRSVEQRLQELQSLMDKGLISQAEYDSRRQEILRSI